MDEYVKKEDVVLALLEKGQRSTRYKLGESWELNLFEIREVIENMPTADVEPVRHGHWILEKHLDLDILICSNCGCDRNCTKYGQYYMKHDKYCPNCGAKLDGGE